METLKAQELRIGNYVKLMLNHEDYEILSVETVDFIHIEKLQGEYEPIPLTEEWLLKFGFNRHHADYGDDVIYIKNVPNNIEFEWGVYPNELGSGIQINNRKPLKYVHQLQNLYFALTGEELTIKPE